jgi:peptide/nickel transport system substrate-binding protein/oligopeptide transport system substrate-binding protein
MKPFLGLVFYAMDLKSPVLSDVRLREAITAAIDRERIVREVYRHTVQPASGLVSDGVPGKVPDACGDRCRHDPDRAKALVAEVFPRGGVPEVAIDHDDDATQVAVAKSIKADLDGAGIPAVLRPHPFADYGQFIVSGKQELFRLGWIADYPSPDAFLFPLFSSTSPDNLTGLASTEVDDVLQAARKEAAPAVRDQLYREVEQKILSQFVVVPVAQLETRMVVARRVQGFTLNPMGTFDGAAVTMAAT